MLTAYQGKYSKNGKSFQYTTITVLRAEWKIKHIMRNTVQELSKNLEEIKRHASKDDFIKEEKQERKTLGSANPKKAR